MNHISHDLLLSVKLDMPHKELFDKLFDKAQAADGKYLYWLRCSHLDMTHPIYLDVTVVRQSTGQSLRYQIPHSMVLLIRAAGPEEKRIGFLE